MSDKKKTVNIFVSLDICGNPQVDLTKRNGSSARSRQATAGDTIKWQKQDNNDKFDITDLGSVGTGDTFSLTDLGGSGQWLACVYNPTNNHADSVFPYTLTVTLDGTPYTTTIKGDAEDDRPVIRN